MPVWLVLLIAGALASTDLNSRRLWCWRFHAVNLSESISSRWSRFSFAEKLELRQVTSTWRRTGD